MRCHFFLVSTQSNAVPQMKWLFLSRLLDTFSSSRSVKLCLVRRADAVKSIWYCDSRIYTQLNCHTTVSISLNRTPIRRRCKQLIVCLVYVCFYAMFICGFFFLLAVSVCRLWRKCFRRYEAFVTRVTACFVIGKTRLPRAKIYDAISEFSQMDHRQGVCDWAFSLQWILKEMQKNSSISTIID